MKAFSPARRTRATLIGAVALLLAVVLVSPRAWAETPDSVPSPAAADEAPVKIHDTTVFVIRARSGTLSAQQRAKNASAAIAEVLKTEAARDVRVETKGDYAVVYAGETPIINVTADDAVRGGDATKEDHAAAIASHVRLAIQTERKRSAIAGTVFSVSLVVLFSLIALYLLRNVADFSRRARGWLAKNPDLIPAVRVKSIEVVSLGVVRSGLDVALAAGRWILQFALVYTWLVAVLSLFESTRGYTQLLAGYVIAPFSNLVQRVGGSLPVLLIVAVAAVLLIVVVNFIGTLFDNVARGQIQLTWMSRELARPTGLLVRIAIVTLALIFAAPLVTGDPDGALSRVGTIALVVVGLASIPLVASALVGISVLYLPRVRTNDFVEVGGRAGRVAEIGLLELRLVDEDGYELRVPHLLSLLHPTRVIGRSPRVSVEVNVTATQDVEELSRTLIEAASTVGEAPSADVVHVNCESLRWRIAVTSSKPKARAQLYLAVLGMLGKAQQAKVVDGARADGP